MSTFHNLENFYFNLGFCLLLGKRVRELLVIAFHVLEGKHPPDGLHSRGFSLAPKTRVSLAPPLTRTSTPTAAMLLVALLLAAPGQQFRLPSPASGLKCRLSEAMLPAGSVMGPGHQRAQNHRLPSSQGSHKPHKSRNVHVTHSVPSPQDSGHSLVHSWGSINIH